MAKAKADQDRTEDWVDKILEQDKLNSQNIEDKKSDNNESTPITNFLLQKQEQIEETPSQEVKEETPSQDVKEETLSQDVKEETLSQDVKEKKYNLEDLEEEGYNIYYNLDEFCGADFTLDKRYVVANFVKVGDELVLSHIVSYEYDEDDSDKISFSNFKATMSQVNGFDNLHYSIQTYKNLTADSTIKLLASLKQKAIDQDPTLSAIILSKNKTALQDAKNIIADENSGIQHIDLPEEDEKTSISNKRKPKTKN